MEERPASLLSYKTHREKFESMYERNQFYRGLFGYKQTVKKNGKKYEYEKEGLMDEIPNVRIDDSVFIVAKKYSDEVDVYFQEWGEKVTHHMFKVILEEPSLIKKLKEGEKI